MTGLVLALLARQASVEAPEQEGMGMALRLVGFAFGVAAGLLACGAQAAQESPKVPDISGFWELRGVLPEIPPGRVTPQAKAHVQALQAKRGLASPEVRWCKPIGVPFFYGMSPPIDIVQDKREVVVMGETLSAPQHIYLNRDFPNMETFDATSNGFSVGRYEGGSLVVETRGFSEEAGNPWIPGGGYKTYDTRLVQRLTPSPDGKKLTIRFTWMDPKVFDGEHSYEFVYDRSDPAAYAQEFFCDAQDPAMGGLVEEPPQQ